MILVDDRTGSKELAPLIQRLSIPCAVSRLDSGDFRFLGNGPDSRTLCIGIERKTIPDLIDSMHSKRYAGHQLPKFVKDHDVRWLYIEGIHKCGDNGELLVPYGGSRWGTPYGHNQVLYRQVDNFLTSSQQLHGVLVKYTRDQSHTAQCLVNLYWWWQKAWEDHNSYKQLYTPEQTVAVIGGKLSLCRAWAAALNKSTMGSVGIGFEKSAAVEAHFKGNALALATATRSQWLIPGVVGPKLSLAIVTAIRGRVTLVDDEHVSPEDLVLHPDTTTAPQTGVATPTHADPDSVDPSSTTD